MKVIRQRMIIVTIAIGILFAQIEIVRADCAFQIYLEKSVTNAVFSLYYEGEVTSISLKSPSGASVDESTYPNAYIREDKILRVGVSSAEVGNWRIQILGKPADGFQVLVASDPSYSGALVVLAIHEEPIPDPTSSETSGTQATTVATEPTASTTIGKDGSPSTSMDSPTVAGVETAFATATNAVVIEGVESQGDVLATNESGLISTTKTITDTMDANQNAGVLEVGKEGGDNLNHYTEPDKVEVSTSSVEPYSETIGDPLIKENLSEQQGLFASIQRECNTKWLPWLEQFFERNGMAIYAVCAIPLLLSVIVVALEIKSSGHRKSMSDSAKERILASFRRKRNPPKAGKHAAVLWRTSTWQEPSEPM